MSPDVWLIGGVAAVAIAAGGAVVWRVRRLAAALSALVDRTVGHELAEAFVFVDDRRLWPAIAAVTLVLAALGWLLGAPPLLILIAALALLALPRFGVAWWRRRRQAVLVRQLPDAMQALAGLLRSGQSLGQALATLADTQPRPLRDEWRLMLRRLRVGELPDRVFEQLPLRIRAAECRLLATTIRVALDLGGSLSEALENLAASTRRRLEMQARIQALTAQGRLQGVIVGLLPVLLLAVLTVMDRDAMSLLWTRPGGWAALFVMFALEVAGFVVIRRIVRIDV